MKILRGKKAIIFGLASQYSLAYGITRAMQKQGAMVAVTYQNTNLKERITKLAHQLQVSFCESCDVSQDQEIVNVFQKIRQHWDQIDIVVHAIAYAPKEALKGDYLTQTTRENFKITHEISSYSFTAIAKVATPFMSQHSALLTLTYLGGSRACANYNVMGLAKASLETSVKYIARSLGEKGIRVNAISAGPVRTVAASRIENFEDLLRWYEKHALLKQFPLLEKVSNTAVCLCSDLMSGVTGEILHVDNGFHATLPVE